MQFSRAVLERIVAGDVTLAFRNWTRPTVKAGTRLRTVLGTVAIEAVEPASPEAVSPEDTAAAGFASVEAMMADLRQGEGRGLYRIRLRFDGPDGRVAAAAVQPTQAERRALIGELARIDAASRRDPWTRETLALIEKRPGVAAAELARAAGREKLAFKSDVRKLKELGLTVSLDTGYRLSARGEAMLAELRGD